MEGVGCGVRGPAQEPGFGWGWRLGYVCVRACSKVGVEVPVPLLAWVGWGSSQ